MAGITSRLVHQVELQSAVPTSDGVGGSTVVWTKVATLRANVKSTGGREGVIAGLPAGVQSWRVELRYREGVTNGHRLVWQGKKMDIKTVADPCDPRPNVSLIAFCDSGVPGGQ